MKLFTQDNSTILYTTMNVFENLGKQKQSFNEKNKSQDLS